MSSFLAQVKERGAELPPALSGALLLAAVRLSEQKAEVLRPECILVDDAGQLALTAADGAVRDAYRAPELRRGTSPPRDPRVLVYAAGALGYELVTLQPLPEKQPGAELKGPLAEIIRKAVSQDRRKRYRDLDEMAKAIEEVQARPTEEEERLILAAVASTTPAPPSQLGKVKIEKKAVFSETPAPGETPQDVHPLLDHAWDPLEAPPPVVVTPEPGLVELHASQAREAHQPTVAGVNETPIVSVPPTPQVPWSGESPDVKSLVEAEAKRRHEDMAVLESRIDNLARLGARLSGIEEKIKSLPVASAVSAPPLSSPPQSLARVVKDLIEERRFADAQRALDVPELPKDALLQLRLGQMLAAQSDMTGGAEAAFRRAAELDPGWALPKALLGAALLRQGQQHEGTALLRAALAIDPSCVEARVALRTEPLRRPALWLVGGVGVAAGVVVAVLLMPRPAPVERIVEKPVQVPVAATSVAPQAAPAPAAAEAPVAREEPRLPPAPETHPVRPPRQHKVAASGNHAAASDAVAKGDKALRSFNTVEALAAFESALKLEPSLPAAHRGMGMVYVLQGKTADAKAEYQKYLQLAPDAPDREQIQRLLSR